MNIAGRQYMIEMRMLSVEGGRILRRDEEGMSLRGHHV